ncbi:MAG: hydrogen peroxide-inducible genes activator [Pseudomonadota bacterium]
MTNLTLKQLRYFDAVARHGHFGRAAETCAVSQPALSVQIKELEASLHIQLFERGPRHVRLTPFGEEFSERVRETLRTVDELGEMARAAQSGLAARLRLGVIPTIAPYLLPKVIARLSTAYPGIDLAVRETQTERLLHELSEGRIDMALVALPVSEAWLTEMPLFTEEFVLVRPKSDADRPVPTAQGLAQEKLLLLEEGHCFRDQALSFCGPHPLRGRNGLDGSSLTTLVQMVAAGLGVTLLPQMAIGVETEAAEVALSRFAVAAPRRTVGVIWRKSSAMAPALSEAAKVFRGIDADP